jgi:hypothetical protein
MIENLLLWNLLILGLAFLIGFFFAKEYARFSTAMTLVGVVFIGSTAWWIIFSALVVALNVSD